MEIKPSFFSVAGFLAPGVASAVAFAAVWSVHHQQGAAAIVKYCEDHKIEGALGVIIGTGVVAALLTCTFVLGCVLSESFIFIGRALLLRPLMRERRNQHFARLLQRTTLDALLDGDLNTREAYVYTRTCGLDLHWYAGRIRMMGGSGLGLLLVGIYAAWTGSSRGAVFLILASVACLGVAIYRSHKFDEFVAATAAVLRIAPEKKSDEKDA